MISIKQLIKNNMSTRNSTGSGGMGILGVLGIVFIVLKLTHVINWSWWWVLAPFWIPLLTVLVLVIIAAIFFLFFRERFK